MYIYCTVYDALSCSTIGYTTCSYIIDIIYRYKVYMYR